MNTNSLKNLSYLFIESLRAAFLCASVVQTHQCFLNITKIVVFTLKKGSSLLGHIRQSIARRSREIVLLLSLMRQIWAMCPVLNIPAQENRDRLLGVLQQNSERPGCRDQHVGKPLCPGGGKCAGSW